MTHLSPLAWVLIGLAAYRLSSAFAGSYCSHARGRNIMEGFFLGLVGPAGVIAAAWLPGREAAYDLQLEGPDDGE